MNEAVPKYVDRLLNQNIVKNCKLPGTVCKLTHMAFSKLISYFRGQNIYECFQSAEGVYIFKYARPKLSPKLRYISPPGMLLECPKPTDCVSSACHIPDCNTELIALKSLAACQVF